MSHRFRILLFSAFFLPLIQKAASATDISHPQAVLGRTYMLADSNSFPKTRQSEHTTISSEGVDLVLRAHEIAKRGERISTNTLRQEMCLKRKLIGNTYPKEYKYAQYLESWKAKILHVGNMNYPEAARRQKLFGSILMTVNIRSDGSLDSVEIHRSSGHPLLDTAAQRIVSLTAPFSPFPPDIRKETDMLSISQLWTFTTQDRLEAK